MEKAVAEALENQDLSSDEIVEVIKSPWRAHLNHIVEDTGVSVKEAVATLHSIVEVSLRKSLVKQWSNDFVSSQSAKRWVDISIKFATVTVSVSSTTANQEELGDTEKEKQKNHSKENSQHYICSSRAPFYVLEDMFHLATHKQYPILWDILEERQDILTNDVLFGKRTILIVLRLANYLLKWASQSYQPVFCGRVMMFLAYALPIDERSGVNLPGWVNKDNTTKIETEEEFDQVVRKKDDESKSDKIIVEEKLKNEDNLLESDSPIDYTLYRNFWMLQQNFLTKPDQPGGILTQIPIWNSFKQRVDSVLRAFEENPFSEADLQRELEARKLARQNPASLHSNAVVDEEAITASPAPDGVTKDDEGDIVMERSDKEDAVVSAYTDPETPDKQAVDEMFKRRDTEFFPAKYLSNSRLLRLELSDPSLRRAVLLQCLVLFQKAERLASLKEKSTGKNADKFPVDLTGSSSGLVELKKRIYKLLEETPSDGKGFVKSVDRTLERESNWQSWKDEKCPPIVRDAIDDGTNLGSKEKRLKVIPPKTRKKIVENMKLWAPQTSSWESELAEENRNVTPDTMSFIKPMMDAIDPENCIEEAYHPKHDELFCFRGLRLLYRYHPTSMDVSNEGSLEKSCLSLQTEIDPNFGKNDTIMKDVEVENTDNKGSVKEENETNGAPSSDTISIEVNEAETKETESKK